MTLLLDLAFITNTRKTVTDQHHRPEDILPPRADALTPVRPTAKERDIAMKVCMYC